MRSAIYSGPARSGICICGHRWDDHHLGMVIRPGAEITDGGPECYIPQECEFYGDNELGGLDADGQPHCSRYRDTLDTGPDK